jgi:hypothetical protein
MGDGESGVGVTAVRCGGSPESAAARAGAAGRGWAKHGGRGRGAARQPARRGEAEASAAGWGWGRRGAGVEARLGARRRVEAEMNEEEVTLVLKLLNFRRSSARPPKITHYFRRLCQRPPKIRQFVSSLRK